MKPLIYFSLAVAMACASVTAIAGGTHAHAHGDTKSFGQPGQASKINRSLKIDMTDAMRFTPSSITVKRGETIKFVITNSGKLKHEFVLGTDAELKEHAELMKKFPEMEHAEPNMLTLAPGAKGEVIWQFTSSGKVSFACLQPGHFDAGMKGAVKVNPTLRHGGHSHGH